MLSCPSPQGGSGARVLWDFQLIENRQMAAALSTVLPASLALGRLQVRRLPLRPRPPGLSRPCLLVQLAGGSTVSVQNPNREVQGWCPCRWDFPPSSLTDAPLGLRRFRAGSLGLWGSHQATASPWVMGLPVTCVSFAHATSTRHPYGEDSRTCCVLCGAPQSDPSGCPGHRCV